MLYIIYEAEMLYKPKKGAKNLENTEKFHLILCKNLIIMVNTQPFGAVGSTF